MGSAARLLFDSKVAFGKQATHFVAEIRAIYEAELRLSSLDLNKTRAVFFVDSQAAMCSPTPGDYPRCQQNGGGNKLVDHKG
jgi:hypothetical protein